MPTIISSCDNPLSVLMIDDTAVVTHLLAREIDRLVDIQLIGTATNLSQAIEKIAALQPDVAILDVELPKLDVGDFVSAIVKSTNRPVIALASDTPRGAVLAMQALTAGAFDVVSKPSKNQSIEHVVASLIERIRCARGSKPMPMAISCIKADRHPSTAQTTSHTVLAIGSTNGELGSLSEVLTHLPATSPGALIVQHLPPSLTTLLAQRLDEVCNIEVKEAVTGDTVITGRALIAPGGHHMLLRRSDSGYFVQIKDGPEVCHQKPSVDVLFNSVAKTAGDHAIGAILSGMGADGAQGLLNMRKAGGHTIVADEQGAAYEAAERVLPLTQIAGTMIEMAGWQSSR